MWSAQAEAEGLTLLVADNKAGYFGVYLNNPGRTNPYEKYMNYLDGSCRAVSVWAPCIEGQYARVRRVLYNLSVKPYAWKRKKGRYVEGETARIVRLFGKWAPYVPACALWGPVFANFGTYDVPVPPPLPHGQRSILQAM